MAGNVKGITIEFRGETTKLDKALKEVKDSTKDIDKSLAAVNKSLKFNPKNVDLLKQKQELLRQKVEKTKDQLKNLNKIQNEMDAKGVDKTSAEYMQLQRNIIETESKLKHFNVELKQTSVAASKLGRMSAKFKEVGGALTNVGHAMQGLSLAAAGAVASVGALTYKSAQNADELNTLSKVYGISTDKLQLYKAAADLVDVSVETLAKSQIKMKRNMLSAKEGTGTASKAFKFLNVEVKNTSGELRSQEEVFQDTIEALGKMKNHTERDAIAMQIFGKSAAELNPLIEDAGETYKNVSELFAKNGLGVVDQKTINQANKFNDELDKIKATGQIAFQTLGMKMAGYLLPVMEKVSAGIQKIAGWLSKLSPRTLTIITAILGVIAVIAPVLLILGKLAFAISSIMGLMATLGVSFAAIAGPVGIVIAVIVGLIAIGIALYKNWDKIKAGATKLWQHIKRTFNNIKNAIISPIQTAVAVIRKLVEKIKAMFRFKISLPKIKLPHFGIQPKGWQMGDLLKGSIPKLGINWYKKGGIFNSPSVIGVGEAGQEAVVPIDKFWNAMDKMADKIISGVGAGGTNQPIIVQIGNQTLAKMIVDIMRKEVRMA